MRQRQQGMRINAIWKARELIEESKAFIAVATRRDEVKQGVFLMSKAVDQEISIAYGYKKPILIFVEKGVDMTSGFFQNYCTYKEFDRESLTSSKFLEEAISSIHDLKLGVIDPLELQLAQQNPKPYFSEHSNCLIELIELFGTFIWRRSHTFRYVFTSLYNDENRIKIGSWADVHVKGKATSDKLQWTYNIDYASQSFNIVPIVEVHTSDCFRIRL